MIVIPIRVMLTMQPYRTFLLNTAVQSAKQSLRQFDGTLWTSGYALRRLDRHRFSLPHIRYWTFGSHPHRPKPRFTRG